MSLNNVIVKGHEVLGVQGAVGKSKINIPINADYFFSGIVKEFDEPKKTVKVESVWDSATPAKVFNCMPKFLGRSGEPQASDVTLGEQVLVCRTGPVNKEGPYDDGLAITDDADSKASFVAFFFTG